MGDQVGVHRGIQVDRVPGPSRRAARPWTGHGWHPERRTGLARPPRQAHARADVSFCGRGQARPISMSRNGILPPPYHDAFKSATFRAKA